MWLNFLEDRFWPVCGILLTPAADNETQDMAAVRITLQR
jgi:hypothetical protein